MRTSAAGRAPVGVLGELGRAPGGRARPGRPVAAAAGRPAARRCSTGSAGRAVPRRSPSYAGLLRRARGRRAELDELRTQARERAQRGRAAAARPDEIEQVDPQPGEDDDLRVEAERLGHAEGCAALRRWPTTHLAGDARSMPRSRLPARSSPGGGPARPRPVRSTTTRRCRARPPARRGRLPRRRPRRRPASYLADVDVDPARLAWVQERRAELTGADPQVRRRPSTTCWRGAARPRRLARARRRPDEPDRGARAAASAELDGELRPTRPRRCTHGAAARPRGRLAPAVTWRARRTWPWPGRASRSPSTARTAGLARHGADDVEILLAANPGSAGPPVAKAASGGELSRVMLALEVVTGGRADRVPTFVFDEVDAGVGGAAALEVGAPAGRARPRTPRSSSSPTCPRSRHSPTGTWWCARPTTARSPSSGVHAARRRRAGARAGPHDGRRRAARRRSTTRASCVGAARPSTPTAGPPVRPARAPRRRRAGGAARRHGPWDDGPDDARLCRSAASAPATPSPVSAGRSGSTRAPRTSPSGCSPATSRSSTTWTSTRSAPRRWSPAGPRRWSTPRRRSRGRYPNLGPEILVDAGIPLLDDVGTEVMHDGRARATRSGSTATSCTSATRSVAERPGVQTDETVGAAAMDEARAGLAVQLEAFAANTMEYLRKRARPAARRRRRPRHHDRDRRPARADRRPRLPLQGGPARRCGRYIREYRPVLIGVDGGADALLEAGLKPDLIVGDMDSVSDARCAAARRSSCTPTATARAPGWSGSQRARRRAGRVPRHRDQRGRRDAAGRRQGRRADRRRRHPRHPRGVPRQGPRRHGQHVPDPAAGRRQARRRQGRRAGCTARRISNLSPRCSCCLVGLLALVRRAVGRRTGGRRVPASSSARAWDDLWSCVVGICHVIDFRYHLVSIVSIFLALAVGIVLGAGPLKEDIGNTLTSRSEPPRPTRRAARRARRRRAGGIEARAEFIDGAATAACSPGTLGGPQGAVVVAARHGRRPGRSRRPSTLTAAGGDDRLDGRPVRRAGPIPPSRGRPRRPRPQLAAWSARGTTTADGAHRQGARALGPDRARARWRRRAAGRGAGAAHRLTSIRCTTRRVPPADVALVVGGPAPRADPTDARPTPRRRAGDSRSHSTQAGAGAVLTRPAAAADAADRPRRHRGPRRPRRVRRARPRRRRRPAMGQASAGVRPRPSSGGGPGTTGWPPTPRPSSRSCRPVAMTRRETTRAVGEPGVAGAASPRSPLRGALRRRPARRRPPAWDRTNHRGAHGDPARGPGVRRGRGHARRRSPAPGTGRRASPRPRPPALGALDDLAERRRAARGSRPPRRLARGEVTTGAVKVARARRHRAGGRGAHDRRARPRGVGRRPRGHPRAPDALVGGAVVAGVGQPGQPARPAPRPRAQGGPAARRRWSPPAARPAPPAAPSRRGAGAAADDLAGQAMLGDAGANAAGALAGTALVRAPAARGRLVVLAGVAGLTLAREKVSFTR